MKKKNMIKIIVGLFICFIVFMVYFLSSANVYKRNIKKLAKEYGLTYIDVSIKKGYSDHCYYSVICADGFADLSIDRMFDFYDEVENLSIINEDCYLFDSIKSNGDNYRISCKWEDDDYIKYVKKNDEDIYNIKTDNPVEYEEKIYEYHQDEIKSAERQKAIESERSEIESNIPITEDEKATCWALAKDVVKGNIKSPSSAKFPSAYNSDGVTISKSDGKYLVNAYVEAENSFGVLIKNNFVVTMIKSGTGDNTKFTSTGCIIDE